jgi:hypothetical protein
MDNMRKCRVTGHGAVRGASARVLGAVVAVLLGALAVFGSGTPAAAKDGNNLVKVFVVQDPAQSGGQLATLQSVAQSTLGDPSRADEIFQLNKGLAQPDGGALNNETDPLHPGWILRLPQDASGPDVQLARDNAQSGQSAPPGTAAQGAGATAKPEYLTLPLPAALGAAGAVLAALVTAAILWRRQIAGRSAALRRSLHRLVEPARRRRRLQARRTMAGRFAADVESVRRAYSTLVEFVPAGNEPETPVHAVRVDTNGVTVWVTPAERIPEPWRKVDETRWRRLVGSAGLGGGRGGTGLPKVAETACLVRVGTDDDDEQVFVDLSRLDGILTVTGDHAVARDLVHTMLAEISRSRPGTPVTVLRGTDGATPIEVPPGLEQVSRVEEGQVAPRARVATASIRGAAARRPVKGVVVMTGTPTGREEAELAALCGPGGAGWTGLVCGEASGAHWRWHTDAQGNVEIPVLGTRLTVPA